MTREVERGVRFWAKVVEGKPTECWRWTGSTLNGYGQFCGEGAHRFAYRSAVGPISDGMVIDHLCGLGACVNPAHLEAVTARENTSRGTHGHPRSLNNTGPWVDIHVRVPDDMYQWLRREAFERDTSIGALVRELIDRFRSQLEEEVKP